MKNKIDNILIDANCLTYGVEGVDFDREKAVQELVALFEKSCDDAYDKGFEDCKTKSIIPECKHKWIMSADSFDQTCYCEKCGKAQ